MVRKRTTLPKDFETLLPTAPLDELLAVFDRCELDARHGHDKATALGMVDCPDELVVWLVRQGLDVDSRDLYGRTPLARRASRGRAEQIALLLSLGADIDAPDTSGQTPLHAAVRSHRVATTLALLEHDASISGTDRNGRTLLMQGLFLTRNADIPAMATIAELLMQRGEHSSSETRAEVERIGRDFEFHRDAFAPDRLEETDSALDTLYELFGVTPVGRLVRHDETSPIMVPEGRWQEQHGALWDALVPSSGAAPTVQGEVIRITGRLSDEILRNGRANWDRDFGSMLDALPGYFARANPVNGELFDESRSIAKRLRSGVDDQALLRRLTELAVQWVGENPAPLRLEAVGYGR